VWLCPQAAGGWSEVHRSVAKKRWPSCRHFLIMSLVTGGLGAGKTTLLDELDGVARLRLPGDKGHGRAIFERCSARLRSLGHRRRGFN